MGIGAVFSSILATVVALALVLGMAWGVIWLLKKLRDRQLGVAANGESDAPIRFLRSMQLGQRERVVLIEARGETMLVGVTAGSVTLLARWPEGQTPAKPVAAPVRF
ncbi:flagellar biosynthetic protein FliO [Sphingomonas sp. ABOLE]|uniref:flagellar biosynthetic protein FliO n=1 Tax=Sphingomonas sp. ABOLE TaxID=1985878 RepID=UPI000F7F54FD|nr:flagellar biosynthetic protein FliO [Sphingomonas sp. ABOLE]RSV35155.1 flagellar biosynthetic protein FliO [Sphingomonas sp. ABOLE]